MKRQKIDIVKKMDGERKRWSEQLSVHRRELQGMKRLARKDAQTIQRLAVTAKQAEVTARRHMQEVSALRKVIAKRNSHPTDNREDTTHYTVFNRKVVNSCPPNPLFIYRPGGILWAGSSERSAPGERTMSAGRAGASFVEL